MMTVPEVPGKWRKSSWSAQETDCVEVNPAGLLRDSKNPTGPRLAVGLNTLLAAVKADHLTR